MFYCEQAQELTKRVQNIRVTKKPVERKRVGVRAFLNVKIIVVLILKKRDGLGKLRFSIKIQRRNTTVETLQN
jgi:hypothetical protein